MDNDEALLNEMPAVTDGTHHVRDWFSRSEFVEYLTEA